MKLSIEQVQQIVELQKQVEAVYKNFDYSIVGPHDVHMQDKTFLETFETFAVRERGCEEYPYEVSAVAGGIKFFAIVKPSELLELENTHPDKFEYISKAIQREQV